MEYQPQEAFESFSLLKYFNESLVFFCLSLSWIFWRGNRWTRLSGKSCRFLPGQDTDRDSSETLLSVVSLALNLQKKESFRSACDDAVHTS